MEKVDTTASRQTEINNKLDYIIEAVADLKEISKKLNRYMFEGNGTKSVVSRLDLLEQENELCEQHRKELLTRTSAIAIEGRKTDKKFLITLLCSVSVLVIFVYDLVTNSGITGTLFNIFKHVR
jgi:hypothetical protein